MRKSVSLPSFLVLGWVGICWDGHERVFEYAREAALVEIEDGHSRVVVFVNELLRLFGGVERIHEEKGDVDVQVLIERL